jgi:hypothetical protein
MSMARDNSARRATLQRTVGLTPGAHAADPERVPEQAQKIDVVAAQMDAGNGPSCQ